MSEAKPSDHGRPEAGRRAQECGRDARTGTTVRALLERLIDHAALEAALDLALAVADALDADLAARVAPVSGAFTDASSVKTPES